MPTKARQSDYLRWLKMLRDDGLDKVVVVVRRNEKPRTLDNVPELTKLAVKFKREKDDGKM